ncbi:MAG: HAMP domain-containing histidine kinase [Gammaproteobacteria bacterium]|nr:HAMP domain-containing histidine kinase [Gammaproteobacteria bacterium]MCP5201123.1 HAMP domain-containing histidine kinase [Gammaproteobacteria bacterium]
MTTPEFSLRARFLLGSLFLSAVLIAGFWLAINQFLEVIEQEFIGSELARDFEHYAYEVERHGFAQVPVPRGSEVLFVDGADEQALPAELRALAPGIHAEIAVGDREYGVAKRRLGERTLYLLLDLEQDPIELLERRLQDIAGWAGVSAVLAGIALSLWLSNLVLAPVLALERRLARIAPGAERPSLGATELPRELGTIARAFDEVLDRFDEFSARERDFTRDASHELRTPLAVIRSSAQLIDATLEPSSVQAPRLARLRAAAEQMQALIDALLFLARGDEREPGEPVSAARLLEEALRLQADAGHVPLDAVQLAIVEDVMLDVPRGLFLCIVNNLLRNAHEHSGDAALAVTLHGQRLVVEDAGPGIDPDLLPRVFERGVRGAQSGGQGIGLDLVGRVCARLGWTLALDSAPGRGTRVELHMADATR